MVDLGEIQAAYYMVAATGVIVAAIYYTYNIRENNRNRRITATSNLLETLVSLETQRIIGELMLMEWKDFDDFYKKYDSSVNPDNLAKRSRLFGLFDIMGSQLKSGLMDMETLYCIESITFVSFWIKFKPIIEEYRKFSYGRDAYENWEYLALETVKFKAKKDPLWISSMTDNWKAEDIFRTFKLKVA